MKHLTTAGSVLTDAGSHPVLAVVPSLALLIGVAATVLALAVGLGAQRAARLSFQGLAPDEVVVSATTPSSSGVEVGLPSTSLTRDDAQALSEKGFVPDGVAAAPTAGLRTEVLSLARSWTTDVIGSTPEFPQVRGYSMASGRFLATADVAAAAPVVVVGETVVQRLFAGDNPVGQQMEIANHSFQVVGVFLRRGFSGTFDQDDVAVIPITAAWSDLLGNSTAIDQVLIQAASPARAGAVKSEATTTLLQRHGFTNPAEADFEVHTLKDLTAEEQQAASAVKHTLWLGAVLLLLLAVVEPNTRRRRSDRTGAASAVEAVTGAAIVTVLGVALAAASIGVVHHLIGGIPSPELRLSCLAWGVGVGLVVGVVAWVPDAVRSNVVRPDLVRPGHFPRLGRLWPSGRR